MRALGIDIGGTGIKGAPVDAARGELLADRRRILTPEPPTPDLVAGVVGDLAGLFDRERAVGCTFPGVVSHGVVRTAANLDKSWIGIDAAALFSSAAGRPVVVLNDADAAGMAELAFGAARGRSGTVLVVTLGTGIGSALFVEGVLVPNTELGHVEIRGTEAEERASNTAREEQGLSWKQYAKRLDEVLGTYERLLSPDLIVIGGGISKRADEFLPHLTLSTEVVTAALRNEAGIVGAAMAGACA